MHNFSLFSIVYLDVFSGEDISQRFSEILSKFWTSMRKWKISVEALIFYNFSEFFPAAFFETR